MFNLKPIHFASLLVLALLSTAAAQDSSSTAQRSNVTITVAATGERVRITAPSTIVQMHVEVYTSSGEKLFDQETRGGNVFDWHLQDGQAQRLAPGAYVCVVTAKSVNGKLTQKLGTVTVAEKSANVQAGPLQLSPQQTQAIGPVEADSSWTIAGENEPQTPTVIANDGTDGQMIRGRGALTFRLGNFFSGIDQEQMRLTEAGDLGIGTAEPQAKLDVAGTIRAQRFLVAKPAKLSSQAQPDSSVQTDDSTNSIQPLVSGVGTTSRLTKWTDGPSGTLGDSGITETAQGFIGIGTPTPNVKLEVNGDIRVTSGAGSIYFDTKNRLYSDGSYSIMTDLDGNPRYYFAKASGDSGNSYHDLGSNINGAHYFRSALGAANLMVIKNNGNVGIGTSDPLTKLDVAGDINSTTQFKLAGSRILSAPGNNNLFAGLGAGNVSNSGSGNSFFGSNSGLSNTGFNNSFFGAFTGANSTGSGNSFFGTGSGISNTTGFGNAFFGQQVGQFNADGILNTFIGMTAGNGNTSGGLNTFIGASAGAHNITGQDNTTVGYRADVGSGSLINATVIGANAQVTQSNSLVLGSINGINSSNLDTNVGIGTTAPANPLDVNGVGTQSGGVGGFGEVMARFRNRPAGNHSALSIDALSGQDAILYLAENGAAVWGIRNDSDQGGKFQIRYQGSGANNPFFTLLSTGEVGIGTTSPGATLHVSSPSSSFHALTAESSSTNGTWFDVKNTDTGGRTWSLISTASNTGTGAGKLIIRDNSAADRALFDLSGNLGIGTDIPLDRLHVAGDIRVGTGTTGCVKDADGTVLTGTCSSDIRFKRNITPFPRLLDRLVRLQPVNFYWKASEYPQKGFGSSQSFGLVAQDVEQVLPELVTEDEQGFKAVRYNKLPLLTLQGLKELKADNDSLRHENAALKQRIESQEIRLRKLETKIGQ